MANITPQEQEHIEQLVEKVKLGDKEAFSELYEIFIQPIYRYVYYRAPEPEVEDIVETAFLKVWEKIHKYRRQKNKSFSAWLFRITHNLIADFYRGRKTPTVELDETIPDEQRTHNPIKHTQNQLSQEYLQEAISKINPQYQEIITLKFINELSNKEISDILKKSEGALRILQFRALKSLKKVLTEMGIES